MAATSGIPSVLHAKMRRHPGSEYTNAPLVETRSWREFPQELPPVTLPTGPPPSATTVTEEQSHERTNRKDAPSILSYLSKTVPSHQSPSSTPSAPAPVPTQFPSVSQSIDSEASGFQSNGHRKFRFTHYDPAPPRATYQPPRPNDPPLLQAPPHAPPINYAPSYSKLMYQQDYILPRRSFQAPPPPPTTTTDASTPYPPLKIHQYGGQPILPANAPQEPLSERPPEPGSGPIPRRPYRSYHAPGSLFRPYRGLQDPQRKNMTQETMIHQYDAEPATNTEPGSNTPVKLDRSYQVTNPLFKLASALERRHIESGKPLDPAYAAGGGLPYQYTQSSTTALPADLYNIRVNRVSRIPCQSQFSDHLIRGWLNDIEVYASPDTCSKLNVISEEFLHRYSLKLKTNTKDIVRLPDNKRVECLGTTDLSFKFSGEHHNHPLNFVVIRNCVRDVVLGLPFLMITDTLNRLKQRLTWIPKPTTTPMLRVCLVDIPQQLVIGSINGQLVSASPDTGSDVNIISKDFALHLNLHIDTRRSCKKELVFIDGSTVITYGIIRDVAWKFARDDDTTHVGPRVGGVVPKGTRVDNWEFDRNATAGDTYICDFYVLEVLTTSIILSSDLLLGSNAFEACTENFHAAMESRKRGAEADDQFICLVKEKKPRRSLRQMLRRGRTNNNVQAASYSPAPEWQVELNRRRNEQNRIDELPAHERVAAKLAEEQRIAQWEQNQASSQAASS